MAARLPELVVADQAAWRRWLGDNHAGPGVWLVLARKGASGPTRLTHDQALVEALCHGWIDGQVQARDAMSFRQRFTPRRARSAWSRRNVELAEELERDGRMHTAGLVEIERARTDGRFASAYDGPATIEVPDDLVRALARTPAARAAFEALTSQNRYAILYRLATARRPDTRTRRLERFVAMLARGETLYPQPDPAAGIAPRRRTRRADGQGTGEEVPTRPSRQPLGEHAPRATHSSPSRRPGSAARPASPGGDVAASEAPAEPAQVGRVE